MFSIGRHTIHVFTDLTVIRKYHVYRIYIKDFLDIYDLVNGINGVLKSISQDSVWFYSGRRRLILYVFVLPVAVSELISNDRK